MSTSTMETFLVREARKEELETIYGIATRAFVHDPVMNYFGSLEQMLDENVDCDKKENLKRFFRVIIGSFHFLGGRVTVVVRRYPVEGNSQQFAEEIIGASVWMPPYKRLSLLHIRALLSSGVVAALKGWGLKGLLRPAHEHGGHVDRLSYLAFKDRPFKGGPMATWYFQICVVEPVYQGRGLCSLLVRDAYKHFGPGACITMDASTARARDIYVNLGFEYYAPFTIGTGIVNAKGLPASGNDACGVELYYLIYHIPKSDSEGADQTDKQELAQPSAFPGKVTVALSLIALPVIFLSFALQGDLRQEKLASAWEWVVAQFARAGVLGAS